MREEEVKSEKLEDRGGLLKAAKAAKLPLEGVWGTQPSLSGGLGASAPKHLT
uniref:hypothetical protein n=1 Tax=Trichocoleus desertorum TaxID=1481672 RepID=UPI0025B4D3CF|nr:hypothetical protein [Trichocoleus desertorum]